MKQKIERSEIRLRRTKKHFIAVTIMSFYLLSLISNLTSCFAQNLVPNPGFDNASPCPAGVGQQSSSWVIAGQTPDYFNPCNTLSCGVFNWYDWVGVPNNKFGSQAARSGCCYEGFVTLSNPSTNSREYIQAQLTPVGGLTAGTLYNVSFYVSNAKGNCSGNFVSTDNIGAYISATAVQAPICGICCCPAGLIAVTPTIVSPAGAPITATAWTLVSGQFTAAGGEQYITIGNFSNDASTTATGVSPRDAYYYIDDVCVSTAASGTCLVALPISLLSFTGNCTENNSVRLNWQTATETNNDYFTVERGTSPDPSKGGGISWEAAGTVKGAGNSSTTRSYEFIDQLPSPAGEGQGGVVYYRLTQTDFDGKTEIFNNNLVAVDITECAVQVFPNPAGNTLNIPYAAEQDAEITLQVYDVIGKLVKEKIVVAVKGHNNFTLDLTTVAQGMYVLRIKHGAKENNQKFVKQ